MKNFLWWEKRHELIVFWKAGETERCDFFLLKEPLQVSICQVGNMLAENYPGAKVVNIVPLTTRWFRKRKITR